MKRFGLFIGCVLFLITDISYSKEIFDNKSDQEIWLEHQKESRTGYNPLDVKYIYSVLYLGMPENEFIKYYEGMQGELKPKFVKHRKHLYYLESIDGSKYRIKFQNEKLTKFQILRRQEPPVAVLIYTDFKYILKGYKVLEGLYRWMTEEEFLFNFKKSIVEKFPDNRYLIAINGEQYTISFLNGYLENVSSTKVLK